MTCKANLIVLKKMWSYFNFRLIIYKRANHLVVRWTVHCHVLRKRSERLKFESRIVVLSRLLYPSLSSHHFPSHYTVPSQNPINTYTFFKKEVIVYLPTAEGPWGQRPSWAEPHPPLCHHQRSDRPPPEDTPPNQPPPAEAWSHLRTRTKREKTSKIFHASCQTYKKRAEKLMSHSAQTHFDQSNALQNLESHPRIPLGSNYIYISAFGRCV